MSRHFGKIFIHIYKVKGEGHILRRLIRASGMTVDQFAKQVGVARQSISPLFKQAELSQFYKEKACEVLNISIDVFKQEQDKTETIVNEPPPPYTQYQIPKEEVERLLSLINSQAKLIENQEKLIEQLQKQNK